MERNSQSVALVQKSFPGFTLKTISALSDAAFESLLKHAQASVKPAIKKPAHKKG